MKSHSQRSLIIDSFEFEATTMSQAIRSNSAASRTMPRAGHNRLSFPVLLGKFLTSRTIFSVTAFALALSLRIMIPKPFRWFEYVTVIGVLLAWPRIELLVHTVMHKCTWTGTYHRHKHHHEHPSSREVPGTYIGYNLVAIPWFFLHWAWPATVVVTVLFAIMIYEFIHFSVHFPYRPITRWGQLIRRNHLLHHRDPTKRLEVVFPKADGATWLGGDSTEEAVE